MISVGLEVGELVLLRLEGFEPAWRQAVVAVSSRNWDRLICAVHVLDSEIEEISTTVSFFELAKRKFILVKGNFSQMRRGCTHPPCALEVDPAKILSRAKEVLETDSPQYLTASEDVAEPPVRKNTQSHFELKESESSSEEDREDAILQLLKKAERSMPEKGTASGSKERVSMTRAERYPMLTQDSKRTGASTSGYEAAVARLMTSRASRHQPQRACPAGIVEDAQRQGHEEEGSHLGSGRGGRRGHFFRERCCDQKDLRRGKSSDGFSARPQAHAPQAFEACQKVYHRDRRAHGSQLGTALPALRLFQKDQLGPQQDPHAYSLYTVSELLQVQLSGKPNQAALQSVQLLRALHQASLDKGSWRAAALLLAHQDPLERQRFGGEPLEQVAWYLKAMEELEKRGRIPQNDPSTKKPNKGKGKKKHDQNAEDTAE